LTISGIYGLIKILIHNKITFKNLSNSNKIFMHSKILILDFGSQFTQLIARRTRELGVYSEIHPFDYSIEKIKADPSIKAIIFSGGPNSVYDEGCPDVSSEIFELGLPILGTCYGLQIIAKKYSGVVERASKREYGKGEIYEVKNNLLTEGVEFNKNGRTEVWMSHGDHLTTTPAGFELIISSDNCEYSGIANVNQKIYAVQFHPEVYHSGQAGKQILANFLFKIANVKADWNAGSFIDEQCLKIQGQVKDGRVLCGLSGGVDSAVVAGIIHKAIGSQIHCVFVDNGLMRYNEKEEVSKAFRDHFQINLTVADASEVFLDRLKGITDPEQKRKIIGKAFIDVFEIAKQNLHDEIQIKADMSVEVVA
jgi:GMP synthase (glutamine-hydrolysing)